MRGLLRDVGMGQPLGYGEDRRRRPGRPGRGRDCYIVVVTRTSKGIQVSAGGKEGGGYSLGDSEARIGCSSHVADAAAWLESRPKRWQRERLGMVIND